MIALWRDWGGCSDRISNRIAVSLGMFAGQKAAYFQDRGVGYAWLPAPRLRRPLLHWRPATTPAGARVLFHGWLDNLGEIASELGMGSADPAAVYGAAVERWSDQADSRLVGSYAAIVSGDQIVRLSRSPWTAPPLCFARRAGQVVAASVPRVLHAAGLPRELDPVKLEDNLYFNLLDRTRGWFLGSERVAHGTIVHIDPVRRKVVEWYDPLAIPKTHLPRDEDYVDAAAELLGEAANRALAGSTHPGVALSGGLDSGIVVDELLRHLEPRRRVHAFTFAPCAAWDGVLAPDQMGDESALVEAYVAMHPRIISHVTRNVGIDFDHRWDELFAAIGGAPNHLCNFAVYHGVWADAVAAGCDALLTADFGNQTFSNDGRWAYVEYLLRGRWRELALVLRQRRGDARSLAHKLIALSIMPLGPAPLRRAVRRFRHPGRSSMNELAGMLAPAAQTAARARAIERGALLELEYPPSRRRQIAFEYAWRDAEGAEVIQGFEQVYGIRQRDVPAYRPLIEFCLGLPTDQFVRDGEERWLAKRLARGRMPEAQRLNPRYGQHNVDWHARMTPRLATLRGEAQRIQARADLHQLVDSEQMMAKLLDWPAQTPLAPEEWMPRAAAVPRALLTARFIDFVAGRNAP